jgi:hypothetical protein
MTEYEARRQYLANALAKAWCAKNPPRERLFAEIAKCDVVRANSHRLRTTARGIGRKRGAR